MINEIKDDAAARMSKSVDALKIQMQKVRTGRAHPSLLDSITVPYYGADAPLNQVGNVGIGDARTLTITVFDSTMIAAVEKAIMSSDLGLNPNSAGALIRIPLPPLTEERRRDLIKVVRSEAEKGRVAIRNIRRDANGDIKSLEKDKDVGEDDARKGEEKIQDLTNKYIKDMDALLSEKEQELMEV